MTAFRCTAVHATARGSIFGRVALFSSASCHVCIRVRTQPDDDLCLPLRPLLTRPRVGLVLRADNSGAAQLFLRRESGLPGGDFDLQYTSLVFPAAGGACRAPASQLAVNPTGGALLELSSDDTEEIEFEEPFRFPFFGQVYSSAHVASNGFGASHPRLRQRLPEGVHTIFCFCQLERTIMY